MLLDMKSMQSYNIINNEQVKIRLTASDNAVALVEGGRKFIMLVCLHWSLNIPPKVGKLMPA